MIEVPFWFQDQRLEWSVPIPPFLHVAGLIGYWTYPIIEGAEDGNGRGRQALENNIVDKLIKATSSIKDPLAPFPTFHHYNQQVPTEFWWLQVNCALNGVTAAKRTCPVLSYRATPTQYVHLLV